MARPAKTLLLLIRDDTFRRDRHAALIESQLLPAEPPSWIRPPYDRIWNGLRSAQQALIDNPMPPHADRATVLAARDLRYDFLDAFSRGVRALHGGRVPWLLGGPELLYDD